MTEKLYSSQVPLTARTPETPVSDLGGLEETALISRMWQQIGQTGQVLSEIGADINKRLQEDQQVNQYSKATWDLWIGINQDRQALTGSAPNTWQGAMEEKSKARLQGVLDQVQDPAVKRHIMTDFVWRFHSMQVSVGHEARSQMIQDSRATAVEGLEKSVQLLSQAQTPEEFAQIKSRYFSLVDQKVSGGILHADQGQAFKQKLEQQGALVLVDRDITADAASAAARLTSENYAKNYPGLTAAQARMGENRALAQVHKAQTDNYYRTVLQVVKATGDNPTAVLPTEADIDNLAAAKQIGPEHQVRLLQMARRGEEQLGGKIKKNSPEYAAMIKEVIGRMHDPEQPMTVPELLKYPLAADDLYKYANAIDNRPFKEDKQENTVISGREKFWRTQWGIAPRVTPSSEDHPQFLNALKQLDDAKEAGALGKTPQEIREKVDQIFQDNYRGYLQDQAIRKSQTQERKWQQQPWYVRQGWVKPPAGVTKPGEFAAQLQGDTVTKGGKTYRVLTIDGRRMVDPTPLGDARPKSQEKAKPPEPEPEPKDEGYQVSPRLPRFKNYRLPGVGF